MVKLVLPAMFVNGPLPASLKDNVAYLLSASAILPAPVLHQEFAGAKSDKLLRRKGRGAAFDDAPSVLDSRGRDHYICVTGAWDANEDDKSPRC